MAQESVSVTSRVRARELAAALGYLKMRGVTPRTRSELVSLCVQAVAGLVDESEWPSLGQSLEVLDREYPVATRRGLHIINTQTSERRKRLIEDSEAMWRGFANGGAGNFGPAPVGPVKIEGEIPEVHQRDGKLHYVYKTREKFEEDSVKYASNVRDGSLVLLMADEWRELDRPVKLSIPPELWAQAVDSTKEGENE